jgi:hypothetical protein
VISSLPFTLTNAQKQVIDEILGDLENVVPMNRLVEGDVVPIFKQLIDYRFLNSQARFLRKHILGKHAQTDFVPSYIKNKFGNSFEILFRKWDLKSISNKEYVVELDALLNDFLLEKLGHKPGGKSKDFYNLVRDAKKVFPLGTLRSSIPQEIPDFFMYVKPTRLISSINSAVRSLPNKR